MKRTWKRDPWLEEAFAGSVADAYRTPQAPAAARNPPAVAPWGNVSIFVTNDRHVSRESTGR